MKEPCNTCNPRTSQSLRKASLHFHAPGSLRRTAAVPQTRISCVHAHSNEAQHAFYADADFLRDFYRSD